MNWNELKPSSRVVSPHFGLQSHMHLIIARSFMQRVKLYDLSPLTMGDLFYLHKSIKNSLDWEFFSILPDLPRSFSAADCCITEKEKTILVFSKEHLYFCNWCIRENDKIIIFHGALILKQFWWGPLNKVIRRSQWSKWHYLDGFLALVTTSIWSLERI